ncbi:alkylation response protein AidB-like acyl-CoA dehydrogenase [Streptomyces sp. Ag109_G2-6]|uniref:acyl-CoA dehydrogenase family protein n=1 Tax=Streptomyces TaxID=1883 RepID=UPI0009A4F3F9|nr:MULTISPECIES: acyl-CoA dehydrogenase family protein [Streptomyces]RPF40039.1 alkylation response protein AidB-like acyl-CoA dehydrogenase [Streptomyces sp. Ag109_G2-6]
MRFLPTGEQSEFARTLRSLLGAAQVPATVRAWAAGDHGPGLALWSRLAGTGLCALAAPEAYEGLGPLPVELALGFVELGRAGVAGPAVETAAAVVLLRELAGHGEEAPAKRFLPGLLTGDTLATLTLPGGSPYALDADAAGYCFRVAGAAPASASESAELWLAPGWEERLGSLDPARGLGVPAAGGELLAAGPAVSAAADTAARWARLLTAAQCLGLGEALLARTVEYVKQRTQFGAPIGSFQAVKHRLADTLLDLEFARPLLWAAALSLSDGDVAAAKLTAGEAAYAAACTALQLHGAVGYTEELDLSLWLRKARPLRDAWGGPSQCRADVIRSLPQTTATRRVTT